MDSSLKGDLCLSVLLCCMCWGISGRGTCAWEEGRAPSRIILHLPYLLWISSSLFLSPATNRSQGRSLYAPWEQSTSELLREKKARDAGRNAGKGRASAETGAQGMGGKETGRFEWRRGGDPPAEPKGTCWDTTHPAFLLQDIYSWSPTHFTLLAVCSVPGGTSVPSKSSSGDSTLRFSVFNVSSNPAWKECE